MLKQRVITALVLLALLLPALISANSTPFLLMTLLFIAAGAWEWSRMNGLAMLASLAMGAVCIFVCGTFWTTGLLEQSLPRLWLLTGACWVLLGAWVLRAGVTQWTHHAQSVRLALGLLALCVTWLAVAQAKLIGTNFLLSMLALVWVADIGAYFAGRAFGGRFTSSKLAASISPGKSWEGVWGGMLGVLVLAFVWRHIDTLTGAIVPSLFTHVGNKGNFYIVLVAVFMAAMSVVGDLIESLVKRSAGIKDSSALLPGHGGVLDRVDALLPVLPLAMMLYSF
jgi:phosphatidate cytidylyltransferase